MEGDRQLSAIAAATGPLPGWPPGSQAAVVVTLSVAAHGLLLLGLAIRVDLEPGHAATAAQAPVSVRLIQSARAAPAALAAEVDAGAVPAGPLEPRESRTVRAIPPGARPDPVAGTEAIPPLPAIASPPPAHAPAVSVPAQPLSAAALPPAPDHHLAATLDPGPRPLADIDFVYPPEAGLRDGLVVVRVLIDDKGDVTGIAVVRSEPAGIFDAAAIRAFSLARFSPGRLAGIPVKSQITAEVEFKPYNRGANVSGRGY